MTNDSTVTRATLETKFNELRELDESIISPQKKLSELYNNHDNTLFNITAEDVYDLTTSPHHQAGDSEELELKSIIDLASISVIPQRILNQANYDGGLSISEVIDVAINRGIKVNVDLKQFEMDSTLYSPVALADILHSDFESRGRVARLPPKDLADYVSTIGEAVLANLGEGNQTIAIPSPGALYHELLKVGVKVNEEGKWYAHRDLTVLMADDTEERIYNANESHLAKELSANEVTELSLALISPKEDGSSRVKSLGEKFYFHVAMEVVEESDAVESQANKPVSTEPDVQDQPLTDIVDTQSSEGQATPETLPIIHPEYFRMADYLEEEGELLVRTGRFWGLKDLDATSLKEFTDGQLSPIKFAYDNEDGAYTFGNWQRNNQSISEERAQKILTRELDSPRHRKSELRFDPGTDSRTIFFTNPYNAAKSVWNVGVNLKNAVWEQRNPIAATIAATAVLAAALYAGNEKISKDAKEAKVQSAYISSLEANQRPDYVSMLESKDVQFTVNTFVLESGSSMKDKDFDYDKCRYNSNETAEGFLFDMIGDHKLEGNRNIILEKMQGLEYTAGSHQGESYWGGPLVCANKKNKN